ncbi:MAG: hypothetical protein U1D96_09615 [Eubacteriales bacterium]|jgi:hypothetical protein|nr:hypothetical protein [Bacillota bacterium]MBV1727387.1 hypothetical protein [Desulforudis sp.]MDZ4043722.1 hypothetical protein [Eubacteriales bacterium]MBU4532861.1 hypothetical protein [Bacillota bacterium]MBU4555133.1 hypothetical protein [Bacillota bacterium]
MTIFGPNAPSFFDNGVLSRSSPGHGPGSGVGRIRPRWQQLVLFGMMQAGIAFLVRLTPVPFGLHSLLLAATSIAFIRLVMRLDWRVSAVAGLLGLTVYVAIETTVSPLLLYITAYSLFSVMESPCHPVSLLSPGSAAAGVIYLALSAF